MIYDLTETKWGVLRPIFMAAAVCFSTNRVCECVCVRDWNAALKLKCNCISKVAAKFKLLHIVQLALMHISI